MSRFRLALAAAAMALAVSASAQDKKWATIKGQVVFPAAKAVPAKEKINVTADKEHCLSKGDLLSEELVVNPKNKGVKNVWVYLKPADGDTFAAGDIHPDLAKAAPKEHVLDQPCCQFLPRILAARQGDTLLVKNSSPVPHNINFNADELSFNQTVAAGSQYKAEKPLTAQKTPATFACNIHPWMSGRAMIFDHPYFAVTDDDGKFEVKNAPEGKYRIFYRHETGFHKGREGAKGFPIDIAGPTTELKPVESEFPEKK